MNSNTTFKPGQDLAIQVHGLEKSYGNHRQIKNQFEHLCGPVFIMDRHPFMNLDLGNFSGIVLPLCNEADNLPVTFGDISSYLLEGHMMYISDNSK